MKLIKAHLRCLYHRLFHRSPFVFEGTPYVPFFHVYNKTWRNERSAEVPIIWKLVQECADGPVLEIGNVLSHYFPVRHDVVDKYERQDGVVLNQDVVDFSPPRPYRLIVTISTLEHVGWDESPREEEKVRRAIEHLKSLLEPGGRLVATIPLGYNPSLDRFLEADRAGFDRIVGLKRLSMTRWAEAAWEDLRGARYDDPLPCANGLVIASYRKT